MRADPYGAREVRDVPFEGDEEITVQPDSRGSSTRHRELHHDAPGPRDVPFKGDEEITVQPDSRGSSTRHRELHHDVGGARFEGGSHLGPLGSLGHGGTRADSEDALHDVQRHTCRR
ncbi:hypothetical protein [Streptomyces sp. NRRL F-3307]|uniref:hypothetical protein n=1 Tax=Streptomyces sp. NRRL F-3307 TaxID=1463849 RepID=UPI00131BCAD3|nr:hypothetical protein [Streptomyces sp. NRRL F-3307]